MIRSLGSKLNSVADLFRSSSILFIGSAVFNVCNILFWFFMVRRLSPVDYGELNSLISLLMILTLPIGTFQTVITQFVSQFHSEDEKAKIKCLFVYFGKRMCLVSLGLLALFIILGKPIAHFLQIETVSLITVTGIGVCLSILSLVPVGTLQGIQRFTGLAVTSVIGGVVKLGFGVLLVSIGLRVWGALWSVVLATVFNFVGTVAYIPRKIFKVSRCHIVDLQLPQVYSHLFPVAASLLCYTILTNSDVVLVKHFFDPATAGYYSVAQMVGKIILFLPGTVCIVLFPKMTAAITRKDKVVPLLKRGLFLAAALCLMADVACLLFPAFVMQVLTHKAPEVCIPLARLFCIAMTFYALVQILIFYFLSTKNSRYVPFLISAAVMQLALISVFHNNLVHVLFALVFCSAGLLVCGLLNVRWQD